MSDLTCVPKGSASCNAGTRGQEPGQIPGSAEWELSLLFWDAWILVRNQGYLVAHNRDNGSPLNMLFRQKIQLYLVKCIRTTLKYVIIYVCVFKYLPKAEERSGKMPPQWESWGYNGLEKEMEQTGPFCFFWIPCILCFCVKVIHMIPKMWIKSKVCCQVATHMPSLFTGVDPGGSQPTLTTSALVMPWPQPPAPMTVSSRACPVMLTPCRSQTAACKSCPCCGYSHMSLHSLQTHWLCLMSSLVSPAPWS